MFSKSIVSAILRWKKCNKLLLPLSSSLYVFTFIEILYDWDCDECFEIDF